MRAGNDSSLQRDLGALPVDSDDDDDDDRCDAQLPVRWRVLSLSVLMNVFGGPNCTCDCEDAIGTTLPLLIASLREDQISSLFSCSNPNESHNLSHPISSD